MGSNVLQSGELMGIGEGANQGAEGWGLLAVPWWKPCVQTLCCPSAWPFWFRAFGAGGSSPWSSPLPCSRGCSELHLQWFCLLPEVLILGFCEEVKEEQLECCYLVVVHAVCAQLCLPEKCGAIVRLLQGVCCLRPFLRSKNRETTSGAGDGSNVYNLVKIKTGRASPNASAQREGEAALFGCFH